MQYVLRLMNAVYTEVNVTTVCIRLMTAIYTEVNVIAVCTEVKDCNMY